jgi:hypothetical protein
MDGSCCVSQPSARRVFEPELPVMGRESQEETDHLSRAIGLVVLTGIS